MSGRVYDPTLGRFISADPYVQDAENTQGHNRYSYVQNGPLSATDPSGYFLKKLLRHVAEILDNDLIRFVVQAVVSVLVPGIGGFIINGFISGLVASGGDLRGGIFGAIAGAATGGALGAAGGSSGYGCFYGGEGGASSGFGIVDSGWASRLVAEWVGQGFANDSVVPSVHGPVSLTTFTPSASLTSNGGSTAAVGDAAESTDAYDFATGATEAADIFWPGFDLGGCIYSRECSKSAWALGVVGTIPGGKGVTAPVKIIGKLVRKFHRFELHHPWPKYLGGKEGQDLYRLGRRMHIEYHKRLDLIFKRSLGREAFEAVSADVRAGILADVARATRKFDQKYGTELYEAMKREGFPGE